MTTFKRAYRRLKCAGLLAMGPILFKRAEKLPEVRSIAMILVSSIKLTS